MTNEPRIQSIIDRIFNDHPEWKNEENERELVDLLFRFDEGMGLQFYIRNGWIPLVIAANKALRRIYPHYKLHQVKEKFGTLRYYTNIPYCTDASDTDAFVATAIVHFAEYRSGSTCENCGATGYTVKTRDFTGWIHVHCAPCELEWINSKGLQPSDHLDEYILTIEKEVRKLQESIERKKAL